MADNDSVSFKRCIYCGEDLPATDCDVPGCPETTPEVTTEVTPEVTTEVTPEVAAAPGACQKCGALAPCEQPDCPQPLAHTAETRQCQICGNEVGAMETCDRPECPRVAVEQIRKASIDTPFKLGL